MSLDPREHVRWSRFGLLLGAGLEERSQQHGVHAMRDVARWKETFAAAVEPALWMKDRLRGSRWSLQQGVHQGQPPRSVHIGNEALPTQVGNRNKSRTRGDEASNFGE